ncbi:unnamed protein product [Gulo gulo]|uniref:Uncharacterized protein n=1 Tax=Gulo gulo TaxID=48420 RepID=A0A9X9M630_GULGU|nr:unnamed protein product [Gulo gulo]
MTGGAGSREPISPVSVNLVMGDTSARSLGMGQPLESQGHPTLWPSCWGCLCLWWSWCPQ